MENVDVDLMKLIEVVCTYFKCDVQEREILIKEATNEPSQFKDSMKEIYENTIKNIINNSEASTIKVEVEAQSEKEESVVSKKEEVITISNKNLVLNEEPIVTQQSKKILPLDATENFNGVMVDLDTYKILDKIVDTSNIKTISLSANNTSFATEVIMEKIEIKEPEIKKQLVQQEIQENKVIQEKAPVADIPPIAARFSRFARPKPAENVSEVSNVTQPPQAQQNVVVKPNVAISVPQSQSSDDDSRTFSARDAANINEAIVKSMSGSKAFRG